MNKRLMTVYAVGIGSLIGFLLGSKEIRFKLKENIKVLIYKMKPFNPETNHSLMEYAGKPDQIEIEDEDFTQKENSKMVSEGSLYGVSYYNEIKEENELNRF